MKLYMKIFKKIISLFMAVSLMTTLLASENVERDTNLQTRVLPNGFTVAVYKNSEPPKRCSMRLLVKTGSLFELENERGLAHFIEHMAFNGTKHFPSGEMTEYFQRLGMAFGSDTNAHTSFTETVYKLELPEVSPKILDESLLLLRDYADAMTFEKKFIDSERSVILAEMNARDDANYRKAVREISLIFEGTKLAERMPIGIEKVVKNADSKTFFDFYRQTYRPDNMVLVVVGDVDGEEIFKLAQQHFESFKQPEAPIRKLDFGKFEGAVGTLFQADSKIKIEAMGVPNLTNSTASLSMVRPVSIDLDSVEARAESDRLNLLCYVLNARMQRIVDTPDAPITAGSAAFYDYCAKALVLSISCDAPVGKHSDAVEELYRQIFSVDSITDVEVENAKKKIFDILQTSINSKSTRKNRALASEITSSFSDGVTFVSPETDMELTRKAFENYGAKELIALFKKVESQSVISLFVTDVKVSKKRAVDVAQKAREKARSSTYSSDKFAVSDIIFEKFSAPSKIISNKKIERVGITQIKFQNGVAFNFKKTDYSKDEVLVNISIGNGVLSVPMYRPEYINAVPALILGGTKFQTASEINAAINMLKMSVSARMSGGSLSINGSSNVRDSKKLIQYIATIVSSAGFRDDAIENLRNYVEVAYKNYGSDPSSCLKNLAVELLDKGVAKVPGSFENFKRYSMKDFAIWLRPILRNDYLEISIVGDFDEAEMLKLVSETFGAMPARQSSWQGASEKLIVYPYGTKIGKTYNSAGEPRSLACVNWALNIGKDTKKMRVATVLSAILDDVLRKDIRENEGDVYSPFAFYSTADWADFLSSISAASFIAPQGNEKLANTLAECGRKLANTISEDEFERAKIPIVKSLKVAERNNRYWLFSVMAKSQAYPVLIEMALNRAETYKNVSINDVREMAREVFIQAPIYISVMPK